MNDEILMSTATVDNIKIVSTFLTQETLQQIGSVVRGSTAGATADNGPMQLTDIIPFYATQTAANEAGDGMSHTHSGQTFLYVQWCYILPMVHIMSAVTV